MYHKTSNKVIATLAIFRKMSIINWKTCAIKIRVVVEKQNKTKSNNKQVHENILAIKKCFKIKKITKDVT